jgi:peptidyl-prolyl cis-trans isomerase B (cyclophilin B)
MKNNVIKVAALILFVTIASLVSASGRLWHVRLITTKGEIILILYDETPLHRDNFVKLSKKGYFNGVLFHRVINDFMIQSGDPDSKEREPGKLYGNGGPDKNVPAEFIPSLFHKRGALAAAREGDDVNPSRESSGSQFYIVEGKIHSDETLTVAEQKINDRNRTIGIETNYHIPDKYRDYYKKFGGTPHLDTQYSVFGEVIEGMDVVLKISDSETDENDRPIEDIYIISAKVFKKRIK